METVYACGFNGFSQISDHVESNKEENNGQQSKQLIYHWPTPLFDLTSENYQGYRLQKAVFAWSHMAVVICKENQNVTKTIVTGFRGSRGVGDGKDRNSRRIFEEKVVIASTDSDLLMQDSHDHRLKSILHIDKHDIQSCSIQSCHSNPELFCIDGASKHFFTAYDSIHFGKANVEICEVPIQEEEPKLRESDQCPVSLVLHHIDSGVRFTSVSCGKEHVLLLSEHGCVYTYGLGSRGQLGHGTVEEEKAPCLVEALEGVKITAVSAGGWHSIAVSEIGDVYSWGWNESGQLGISSSTFEGEKNKQKLSRLVDDDAVGIQAEPRYVKFPEDLNIKFAACGSRHTLCLTDTGRVFASGWNGYGQLGLGHCKNVDKFVEISFKRTPCTKIFAGHWNSVFVCRD